MKWADLKTPYDIRAAKYTGGKYLRADRKHEVVLDAVRRCMDHVSPKRFLDAGCGNGIYLKRLAEPGAGPAMHGVDFSESMVRIARDNGEGKNFVVGNLEEVPYRSESFEVILCAQVIEHMLDDKKAMGELARLLSAGGYLVISTDNKDNTVSKILRAPLKPLYVLAGFFRRAQTPEKYFPHKEYSRNDFEELIRSCGLDIERLITYRFSPPPPLTRLAVAKAFMALLENVSSKFNLFGDRGDILLAVCRKNGN